MDIRTKVEREGSNPSLRARPGQKDKSCGATTYDDARDLLSTDKSLDPFVQPLTLLSGTKARRFAEAAANVRWTKARRRTKGGSLRPPVGTQTVHQLRAPTGRDGVGLDPLLVDQRIADLLVLATAPAEPA